MKSNRIPLTFLTFDLPIYPSDLRAFRGAVIENALSFKPVFEAAAIPTDIFHNHLEAAKATSVGDIQEEEEAVGTQFRYPLIQYKISHRKAAILGIGKGAQALQLWMSMAGETLSFQGREVPLALEIHQHSHWVPEIGDVLSRYRLNKWLPFNAAHFKTWNATTKLTERVALLERVVWGHLWQMLDALDIPLDRSKLVLHLSSIDMMTFKDSYGIKRLALDVTFASNLLLPDEIGLGQGISIGFGKVQRIKTNH